MIIYNVTTKVHVSVDADWLQWQREEHIPAMMNTGFFTSHQILHLLEQDDSSANTYAVQFTIENAAQYREYVHAHAPVLRKKAIDKWGDKIISFHSLLEVLQ